MNEDDRERDTLRLPVTDEVPCVDEVADTEVPPPESVDRRRAGST